MNKYGIILSTIFFLMISCKNNNQSKNDYTNDSITAEVRLTREDSALLKFPDIQSDTVPATRDTTSLVKGSDLKTADDNEQYSANQKSGVRSYIAWLRKQWQQVPNPISATYQGNDFGDYQHILFKDANKVVYDFGQAKNNYGQYKLHKLSGQNEDNPEFLGKIFKVYWEWKLTEFLCCDGEYDKARAYVPSITKLELIKN